MYKNNYLINEKENLYYLHKENIEFETIQLLEEYFPECLKQPMEVPVEKLALYLDLDVITAKLSEDGLTYGTFIFNKGLVKIFENPIRFEKYNDKTILIDNDLYAKQNGLFRFTLGHEIRTLLDSIQTKTSN